VLDRVGGQRHAPAALPPGKTRHPLYRRLGGPQGRSLRVRKISPPPGFNLRTVKREADRNIKIDTYELMRLGSFNLQYTKVATLRPPVHMRSLRNLHTFATQFAF
jgi:hypothetical protein